MILVQGLGPRTARIAIVGQAPAADEIRSGIPFIGRSGQQLNQVLPYAALRREDLYITNVFQRRLNEGETAFSVSTSEINDCLERLATELRALPDLCVVVALGEDAMWALTGMRGVTKWRGSVLESSLLPGVKVIPSVHPAWIIRGQWEYRTVLICDLERAERESHSRSIVRPVFDYIIGPSFEQACDTMLSFDNSLPLSIDLELHRRQFIACVGFANGKQPALCVPYCFGDGSPIWTPQEEQQLWQITAGVIASPIPKVGQNIPFDIVWLLRNGIVTRNVIMDTITEHHCYRVEMPHTLAFMVSIHTDEPFYKDEGRHWHPSLGHDAFWLYNIKDAYWTLRIAEELRRRLEAEGLWDLYRRTYIRELPLRVRMEWEGVHINVAMREQVDKEISHRIEEIQREVDGTAGYALNVQSPKQLQKFLYEERRYRVVRDKRTGRPTVNKQALSGMSRDKVVGDIIELRGLLDLRGDVIRQELTADNRIHCHYGYAETVRWTSGESVLGTGTNLQNIPRTGPARKLFIPDREGMCFLSVDLTQAEAMVVAWTGPVPGLKTLFESGGDVHLEVARLVNRLVRGSGLKLPLGLFMDDPLTLSKSSAERQIMKHAVHGSNYDMGRKRFAQTAASKGGKHITDMAFLDAAMRAQDLYFQLFPEVRGNYHRRIQDELRQHRAVWTFEPFRWRRHFHAPLSDDTFREAYAFIPQYMVAKTMNEILLRIDAKLWQLDSCIRMQIHDEGVIQTWPHYVKDVVQMIYDVYDFDLDLPAGRLHIPVAFKVGPSLGELEDFKP